MIVEGPPADIVLRAAGTSVSSVTRAPGIGARRAAGAGRPRSEGERVEVAVAILSASGVRVEDGGAAENEKTKKKKKKKKRQGFVSRMRSKSAEGSLGTAETAATSGDGAATTLVASFPRAGDAMGGRRKRKEKAMAHVPSLPLPLPESRPGPADAVVRWPTPPRGGGPTHRLRPGGRFEVRPLPVRVALSRRGRLFELGTALVLLTGDEDGSASVDVPIRSRHPAATSPRWRKKASGGGEDGRMMKIRGDTLRCSLDPNAALRVRVRVGPPRDSGTNPGRSPIGETPTATTISSGASPARPRPRQRRGRKAPRDADGAAAPRAPTGAADADGASRAHNPAAVPLEVVGLGGFVALAPSGDGTRHDADRDCDDEPSCTSSAYMSVSAGGPYGRRPRRGSEGTGGPVARSRSTATAGTAATGFSLLSDLTDERSVLSSPTGVEVVPLAAAGEAAELPPNSRLLFYEDERDYGAASSTRLLPRMVSPTPSRLAASGWRRRLSCAACGSAASVKDLLAPRGGDGLLLRAPNGEEDAASGSSCWGFVRGSIGRYAPLEIPPGASEDGDASLVEYEGGPLLSDPGSGGSGVL